MKTLKAMFEATHDWVSKQRTFVQITLLFIVTFVVLACLIVAVA